MPKIGLAGFARGFALLATAKVGLAALAALLGTTPAARAEAPYLQLVETVVDDPQYFIKGWTISDGAVTLDLYNDGSYTQKHTWSSPPPSFDANGFDISLSVVGHVKSACQSQASGTGISGLSFEITPDSAGAPLTLTPPQNCDPATAGANDGSNSVSVHVKPRGSLGDGETVELKIGAFWGPGVTYRYKVSATGTPPPPPNTGVLAATIECDSDTIVISALPSLNCHIVFTSWRRNTADPVDVSFPAELDSFGNHANGIQLTGRGNEDIFNWDSPHRWGLFVFACPSQKNTGANCYGSVTAPGPVSVPIVVTQKGSPPLNLVLTLNAVAHGGAGGGGGQVARIGNRWIAGAFIHIENGPVVTGPILVDWLSAQWQFEKVEGTEFVRLKNIWKPDVYIHCEQGDVEAGQISPDWWSAMWVVEQVGDTGYFRMRNRWKADQYLNTESGALGLGMIRQDWLSAMWWTLQ